MARVTVVVLCVCVYVCVCVHSYLPPHTLERRIWQCNSSGCESNGKYFEERNN